jgi:hypothetical protein
LKTAILVYVWNTFLDSDNKEFLKPVEKKEDLDAQNEDELMAAE